MTDTIESLRARVEALERALRAIQWLCDRALSHNLTLRILAIVNRVLPNIPVPDGEPVPQEEDDARDARRYRWLRQCTGGEWDHLNDVRLVSLEKFDAAIDAALQPSQPKEPT